MIYDRVLGKPPEHVAIEMGDGMEPWKKLFAASIVASREDVEVVEGEIVEDGDLLDDTRAYDEYPA